MFLLASEISKHDHHQECQVTGLQTGGRPSNKSSICMVSSLPKITCSVAHTSWTHIVTTHFATDLVLATNSEWIRSGQAHPGVVGLSTTFQSPIEKPGSRSCPNTLYKAYEFQVLRSSSPVTDVGSIPRGTTFEKRCFLC